MQYSEPIHELHKNGNPLDSIGDCRFCGICGALIHPDRENQHTNYHATVQRILDELSKFAVSPTATAWNGWLDLDNLRNGELT